MKKAFTLVELLVVVVVITVLLTIMFKLAGIGGESAAINLTVDRMSRLENALSGYYAAFGTYPPVKLHGSRNPFLKVNDYGDQSQDGDEDNSPWGNEEQAWKQAKAACLAQPVACMFPFPKNVMKETVRELSEEMKLKAEDMSPSSNRDKLLRGFDDGVSENIGRFNDYKDEPSWAVVQLFRFGLMSFLLPRYMVMLNSEKELFEKYAQWTEHNTRPRDPLTGRSMSWKDVKDHVEKGADGNNSELARVANISSQAACARWMASFEHSLTCFYEIKLFGVTVSEPGAEIKFTVDDIRVPGGYGREKMGEQYILDMITMCDGWGNDLYYYSPAPYQSYIVWSAGPNGRTFPPWISREKLDAAANRCIGRWIADDIVNLSR